MSAPRSCAGVALTLHFNPVGDLLEAARECEAEIFQRWYGNSRAQLDEEYGPYEHASAFIVLCDETDVVGVTRVTKPSELGLKTLADVGNSPWQVAPGRAMAAAGLDPDSTWDVATIGVRSGCGLAGRQCAAALYHGLVLTGRVNEVRAMVAILDERVRGMLESAGLSMHALPGTRPMAYLGSAASTPVYGELSVMLDRQRRLAPDAYRLVTLGVGLNGVSVPPPEAFAFPAPHPATALPTLFPRLGLPDLNAWGSAGRRLEEGAAVR